MARQTLLPGFLYKLTSGDKVGMILDGDTPGSFFRVRANFPNPGERERIISMIGEQIKLVNDSDSPNTAEELARLQLCLDYVKTNAGLVWIEEFSPETIPTSTLNVFMRELNKKKEHEAVIVMKYKTLVNQGVQLRASLRECLDDQEEALYHLSRQLPRQIDTVEDDYTRLERLRMKLLNSGITRLPYTKAECKGHGDLDPDMLEFFRAYKRIHSTKSYSTKKVKAKASSAPPPPGSTTPIISYPSPQLQPIFTIVQ